MPCASKLYLNIKIFASEQRIQGPVEGFPVNAMKGIAGEYCKNVRKKLWKISNFKQIFELLTKLIKIIESNQKLSWCSEGTAPQRLQIFYHVLIIFSPKISSIEGKPPAILQQNPC